MVRTRRFLKPCWLTTLLATALLLTAPPCRAHILALAVGDEVSFDAMLDDLQGVRVVFIGELHDRPGHHRAQLQVIRALHQRGMSLAIGLEMFRAEQQPVLDRWVAGDLSEREFLPLYRNNWGLWPLYRDIFFYARENDIPLVGLNLPREITRQVASSGFESLSPQQRAGLPLVRCDVDQKYQDYMRRMLGRRVHHGTAFDNFCQAQMVWDVAMARNLLLYLEEHPQRTVVVLAGSGHAWKFGIPEQLGRHARVPYRVLVPEIPGRIERNSATAQEADYLLLGTDQGPLH